MLYGSICCTYHQLKYSSPNRSKKQNKNHTKSPPFGKWRFRGKRGQENGPKAETDKTERATGLGRRKRGESWIKLTGWRHQNRRPPFGGYAEWAISKTGEDRMSNMTRQNNKRSD